MDKIDCIDTKIINRERVNALQTTFKETASSTVLDIGQIVLRNPALAGTEEKISSLLNLVEPVIYWATSPLVIEDNKLTLQGKGGPIFESAYLTAGLKGTKSATLAAITIGKNLPNHSSLCMERGEFWEGVVADILGSEAIELLADIFFKDLANKFEPQELYPTLRYSPGYGDWPLKDQSQIIGFLKTEPTVVSNESFMLEPVKSITALTGWSEKPVSKKYPTGNKSKGLCMNGQTCSNCRTWACKK